jgi:hypothetical protein
MQKREFYRHKQGMGDEDVLSPRPRARDGPAGAAPETKKPARGLSRGGQVEGSSREELAAFSAARGAAGKLYNLISVAVTHSGHFREPVGSGEERAADKDVLTCGFPIERPFVVRNQTELQQRAHEPARA